MTVKNILIVPVIILCFGLLSCGSKAAIPLSKSGVLDLSGVDFSEAGSVELQGEWEFYWDRLLTPSDFLLPTLPIKTGYIKVPGYWNTFEVDGKKLPAAGCATYRLKIKIQQPDKLYGIIIPEMVSSYRLWIDGNFIAQNGVVSRSPQEMKPQFVRRTQYFAVKGNEVEIVCQVANSSYRKSGIWLSMKMGYAQKIERMHDFNIGIEVFLAGCLLIMALYHMGLFVCRRKDRTPLYFGLFCLVIVIRIITTGEHILERSILSFDWGLARKLEYSPFYIGGTFFMLFLSSVFPN